MSSDDIISMHSKVYGDFGPAMHEVNMTDEDADKGLFSGPARKARAGRLTGRLDDQAEWAVLSDGSRITATILGQKVDAAFILLSSNAPNSVESSGATLIADQFRMITGGSCRIGDKIYHSGEFLALEAGQRIDEIVHGPDGSEQVILSANHKLWRPREDKASARQSEIEQIVSQIDTP